MNSQLLRAKKQNLFSSHQTSLVGKHCSFFEHLWNLEPKSSQRWGYNSLSNIEVNNHRVMSNICNTKILFASLWRTNTTFWNHSELSEHFSFHVKNDDKISRKPWEVLKGKKSFFEFVNWKTDKEMQRYHTRVELM